MRELSDLEKKQYEQCSLCPRECKIDRINGEIGFCKMGINPKVARAALHYWEEPCISGEAGSGAVFFSGCNLHCVFCQNHKISRGEVGMEISGDRLSEIFINLQNQGANNINLVTGVMFIPTIIYAIKRARANGLSVPIIYNSSGYESVEALQLLDGYVDVYLPDFKYYTNEHAKKYSLTSDYFNKAIAAIDEMVRQVGSPIFDEKGFIKKGVIIRHLLLPGKKEEAKEIVRYLYEKYGERVYISIMNQYTPIPGIEEYDKNLGRRVTTYEYQKVIDYALSLGITKGYMQEGKTAEESFIPDFNMEGI